MKLAYGFIAIEASKDGKKWDISKVEIALESRHDLTYMTGTKNGDENLNCKS